MPEQTVPGTPADQHASDLINANKGKFVRLSPGAVAGQVQIGDATQQVVKQQRTKTTRGDTLHRLARRSRRLDLRLKRLIGYFAFIAGVLQLLIANAVFLYYAWWRPVMHGVEGIPSEMLAIWYSSVVVQVIGILMVVTRYVFPKAGLRWDRPRKKKNKKRHPKSS